MLIKYLSSKKHIIILQGGSGAGKTSLANYLTFLGIPRVITCTTRKPRPGELNGKDYYFCKSKESFLANDLLEYAEYSGNLYGTRKQEVEQALQQYPNICLILEQEGAEKLKKAYSNNVILISLPIDSNAVILNLKKRGDSEEFINERLKTLNTLKETKALGFADYIITGNDLESKKESLKKILKTLNIL